MIVIDSGQRERLQEEENENGKVGGRGRELDSESTYLCVRYPSGTTPLWEPILAARVRGPKMDPRG
jgi:hypothetical protein